MTTQFQAPRGFDRRVRDSFARQSAMNTIGVRMGRVEPGAVELVFPYADHITQQNGFIHGGIVSTVLDSACGYSALSLMALDRHVLTIEFKVNLLSPAKGERFIAIGKVKKPGRTITVAEGDMYAETGGDRKLIASMVGTFMALDPIAL